MIMETCTALKIEYDKNKAKKKGLFCVKKQKSNWI